MTEPFPDRLAPADAAGGTGSTEGTEGTASRGALTVTGGMLVAGATSYGFLTLAARSLPTEAFSAVAALWSLVYAFAGGFFLPLEQETTRAVAERVSRGERALPVVLRVSALCLGLVVVIDGGLALVSGPLSDRVFGGQPGLVWALCVALAAMSGLYVTRGLFAGTSHFVRYAGQLAGEGTVRLVLAVAVVVAATAAATAGSFAVAVALAPVVALLVSLVVLPRVPGRAREARWPEVTQNLGLLLVASVVAQGMANAGPIVLQLIGGGRGVDAGLAGRFLAAFVLVRLPLFFTGALQAALLPRLVRAAEEHDRAGYDRSLRQMLAVVAGLGAVGLGVFALVGPQVLSLLFGPRYEVGRPDLVLLALSSVLLLLAALVQSAVIALRGHREVALAWSVSGVVFVVGCLLPLSPLPRIEAAYVAASVVVLVLLWLASVRQRPLLTR